jgi:transposase
MRGDLCSVPLGRPQRKRAVLSRFVENLEARLHKLAEQAQAGKTRDRQKVERQIGRLLERNSRAASLFRVEVTGGDTGQEARLSIQITKNEERYWWVMETGGSYILRTNWSETDPKTLWNTYIQLTQVEDSFRTEKYDLGMRPIFHHKEDRTQAHILV